MIMPGIGDAFVPAQARLLFALALSFIVTPILAPLLPKMPESAYLFVLLIASEAMIGVFIGTIMRIMIAALDTAGAMISFQASFSNAILFNPATESQGSIMSGVYSAIGVALLMVTNFHHVLLASIVESYNMFPVKELFPDTRSIAETISQVTSLSFKIGVQMALPFIIIGTLLQIGFGLLGRLMPQLQIFFLVMPVQIFVTLVIALLTVSASMLFWLEGYDAVVTQTFSAGGGDG